MDREPDVSLAREWWANRARGAEALSLERSDFDSLVEELAESPVTLGKLLEVLNETAPGLDELRYVGTVILEDGYAAMGAQAFLILEQSSLPPVAQKAVLSGFRF